MQQHQCPQSFSQSLVKNDEMSSLHSNLQTSRAQEGRESRGKLQLAGTAASVSPLLWDHTPGNLQSPINSVLCPPGKFTTVPPYLLVGGMLGCKLKVLWDDKTGKTSARQALFMSHSLGYFLFAELLNILKVNFIMW